MDRTQFKRGQFVYVANDDFFENQTRGRADGESRFVARILDLRKDVKEEVSQTTYAVVAWAYRPSELRGDASRTFRKCPSIDNELILSDHGEGPIQQVMIWLLMKQWTLSRLSLSLITPMLSPGHPRKYLRAGNAFSITGGMGIAQESRRFVVTIETQGHGRHVVAGVQQQRQHT